MTPMRRVEGGPRSSPEGGPTAPFLRQAVAVTVVTQVWRAARRAACLSGMVPRVGVSSRAIGRTFRARTRQRRTDPARQGPPRPTFNQLSKAIRRLAGLSPISCAFLARAGQNPRQCLQPRPELVRRDTGEAQKQARTRQRLRPILAKRIGMHASLDRPLREIAVVSPLL